MLLKSGDKTIVIESFGAFRGSARVSDCGKAYRRAFRLLESFMVF